jgi:hypothetical protein
VVAAAWLLPYAAGCAARAASIAPTSNPDELEATLDDGAVVCFTVPGGPLPAPGRVELGLSRRDTSVNPFNTYSQV